MRLLLLLLVLAGPAAAAAPAFDAIRFFTGRTEGTGRMKVMMGPHRAVQVHGEGRVEPDGTLVLAQTVDRAGRPPTTRAWRMWRVGATGYAGTLSDARGPIVGETVGNRLHLRYRGAGVWIEQWLTLADDGRSATNHLTAHKLGMVVARLDETIRRVD